MNNKNLIIYGVVLFSLFLSVSTYIALKNQTPTCKGIKCIDKDARFTKCAKDAQTALKENVDGIEFELRYSPKCDAAWSRAILPPESHLYVEDAKGKQYGYYIIDKNDPIKGAHYCNMGPGKNLKACANLPDGKRLCTKLGN
jgi:hypothetical protein